MIRTVLAAAKAALEVVLVIVREDRLRRAIQELLTAVLTYRRNRDGGNVHQAPDAPIGPDDTECSPQTTEDPREPYC
jgi:hypothetical protein